MINENDKKQQVLAFERLKNTGKLFVDMQISSQISQCDIDKTHKYIDSEFEKSELIVLAIKNSKDQLRLVQIDHMNLVIEVQKNNLMHDIQSGLVEWWHDQKSGTHFKYKQKSVENQLSQPVHIVNIYYNAEENSLIGVQEHDSDIGTRTRAYILKAIIHQRTGERFYQVYIENPSDTNQSCNIIVSGETLQDWDRLRIVQVMYPMSIIDISKTDNNGELLGDISQVDKESGHLDTNALDNSLGGAQDTQLEDIGIGYNEGKKQLLELLGYQDEDQMLKALAKADGTYQLESVGNLGVSTEKQEKERDTVSDNEDTYAEQLSRLYYFKTEIKQPIEEYLQSNLEHLGTLQDIHKGIIGGSQLNNSVYLRVVETNANKIQNAILDQGLLEASGIQDNLKLSYVQIIKQKAMQACSGLYPSSIELSLVDMLQVFKYILPIILSESLKYRNYIKSCYQQNGLKCNFKKRDRYIELARINPYIQLDLAQKKQPIEFVNLSKSYKYKEIDVQFLALKALNGLDACENGIRLGNRYAEDEEFRKMKVLK